MMLGRNTLSADRKYYNESCSLNINTTQSTLSLIDPVTPGVTLGVKDDPILQHTHCMSYVT